MTTSTKPHKFSLKRVFILTLLIMLTTIILFLIIGTYLNTNKSYLGREVGQSIVFIIPGLFESEDNYKLIEHYYNDVGITPIYLDVDWMKFNFQDMIEAGSKEIDKVISLYPDRDIYFFGFSIGAVIALGNAEKYGSKGTILCSLSPVFEAELKDYSDWFIKMVSPPNYISVQEETTIFLYGDHDNSAIRSDEIVSMRKQNYTKSDFILIKGAEHDITGEAYLEQVKKIIYRLREDDDNEN